MKKFFRPRAAFFLLAIFFILMGCSAQLAQINESKQPVAKRVTLGVENFLMHHLELIKNKRVGLLTNPSGVNHLLQSTADLFSQNPAINLTALFGPEHGIRGAIYAGEHVGDEVDPHTGVQVFSLYGKQRKPTAEMIKDVDVFIVDIQDVGVRAYTYIYTMAMVMEAAADSGKEVIVLDRPNPLGGEALEGNLAQDGFFSFVGLYPIPYRHGMTIGELAKLFNQEFNIHCKLTVIPMLNWKRDMYWGDTGLPWVPTSPHVPHWKTTLFMSATGTFGELRVLSEGVGYTSPFEIVGAPWIDGYKFAKALNDLNLPGVVFRPLYYKPYYASYKGQVCQGVQIHLTDFHRFNSFLTGLYIMQTVRKLYPEQELFKLKNRAGMFNKVVGCAYIQDDIKAGVPIAEIQKKWQDELNTFRELRKKYLIY